jgi:Uridine phosphorylase
LHIIRLGTSGSLQADIPVDAFVVSTHGIGLDNVLHYYQYQPNQKEEAIQQAFSNHIGLEHSSVMPYAVEASAFLASYFDESFHKGMTVTCPGFYAPQGRVVRATLQFPEMVNRLSSFSYHEHRVTNFEMETSAIFGLGKVLGHQCLAVNTIVANRIRKEFSTQAPKQIDLMIQRSLSIIEQIPS